MRNRENTEEGVLFLLFSGEEEKIVLKSFDSWDIIFDWFSDTIYILAR